MAGLGTSAFLLCPVPVVLADCRLELELLGADLKGIVLTEQQKLQLAPFVDDALKRCRLGREDAARYYLDKARAVTGITRKPDDIDTPAPAPTPAR